MRSSLSVNIGDIELKNPIMPASGTFGYGEEYAQFIDLNKLGAIVTKGTTLKPRRGNPQPRLLEVEEGLINFIGLENPGVKNVIRDKIPFLRQFETPIIVNIAGETKDEFRELAEILDNVKGISGLEINISCPNIKKGGMAFGQDPELTSEVVRVVREATKLLLIVKLTPNVTDIVLIAKAAVEAGANALSLINTVKARAKIYSGPNTGKWIIGGLSGPCVKPIALQKLSEIIEARLEIPIIGMGGIMNTEDAIEFLELGATAIGIGTANFVDPCTMIKVIKGIREYLVKKGIDDVRKLRVRRKEKGERNGTKR